jgi:hypothetical protein
MPFAIGSGLVCVATWLGLAVGAGYVGLSRSVSVGVMTLVENPAALVAVAVIGVTSSFSVTRAFRLRPLLLLLGVLIGDAFAAEVLAPIAIGELEVSTGVPVFLAITVAGLQPAAVVLGSWSAARRARPSLSTDSAPAA